MGKKKNNNNKRKDGNNKKETKEIITQPPFPWKIGSLPVKQSLSVSQRGPTGRMGASVIAAPNGSGCVGFVVGGYNEEGCNDEVWKFKVEESIIWSKVRTSRGASPFPRIMSKSCSLQMTTVGISLFVFGGTGENGENLNDLWQLPLCMEPPVRWHCLQPIGVLDSPSNQQAAQEDESLGAPPQRCNHAMASVQSQSGNGYLFIHGGESNNSPIPLNDLWVVDMHPEPPQWVEASSNVVSGNGPSPRCSHEAIAMQTNRSLIFFGGVGVPMVSQDGDLNLASSQSEEVAEEEEYDGVMPLNDVFILHLGNLNSGDESQVGIKFGSKEFFKEWRWSSLANPLANSIAPSPRSLPALAMHEGVQGEVLFVFGGYGLFEDDTDESKEDLENIQQEEGDGVKIGYLNDLWAFNIAQNRWICSKDATPQPDTPQAEDQNPRIEIQDIEPRNGHGMCMTQSSGLVTFGGYSGGGFLNQLLIAPPTWSDEMMMNPVQENDDIEDGEEEDGGGGDDNDDDEDDDDEEEDANDDGIWPGPSQNESDDDDKPVFSCEFGSEFGPQFGTTPDMENKNKKTSDFHHEVEIEDGEETEEDDEIDEDFDDEVDEDFDHVGVVSDDEESSPPQPLLTPAEHLAKLSGLEKVAKNAAKKAASLAHICIQWSKVVEEVRQLSRPRGVDHLSSLIKKGAFSSAVDVMEPTQEAASAVMDIVGSAIEVTKESPHTMGLASSMGFFKSADRVTTEGRSALSSAATASEVNAAAVKAMGKLSSLGDLARQDDEVHAALVDMLCLHFQRVADSTQQCAKQALVAVTAASHVCSLVDLIHSQAKFESETNDDDLSDDEEDTEDSQEAKKAQAQAQAEAQRKKKEEEGGGEEEEGGKKETDEDENEKENQSPEDKNKENGKKKKGDDDEETVDSLLGKLRDLHAQMRLRHAMNLKKANTEVLSLQARIEKSIGEFSLDKTQSNSSNALNSSSSSSWRPLLLTLADLINSSCLSIEEDYRNSRKLGELLDNQWWDKIIIKHIGWLNTIKTRSEIAIATSSRGKVLRLAASRDPPAVAKILTEMGNRLKLFASTDSIADIIDEYVESLVQNLSSLF